MEEGGGLLFITRQAQGCRCWNHIFWKGAVCDLVKEGGGGEWGGGSFVLAQRPNQIALISSLEKDLARFDVVIACVCCDVFMWVTYVTCAQVWQYFTYSRVCQYVTYSRVWHDSWRCDASLIRDSRVLWCRNGGGKEWMNKWDWTKLYWSNFFRGICLGSWWFRFRVLDQDIVCTFSDVYLHCRPKSMMYMYILYICMYVYTYVPIYI